ncbi:QWRF motif-containing protein 2 [Camellia lanceoleosa]|uniref:QWRF motif-containing protein 2 n=1 Tax=Camellia lanceoleosa TaxID=1840588 RepID=A0ACC0FLE2_9ERIC|nr:QWRF motif-containing protein 2 [Camellia lanceoleosa]
MMVAAISGTASTTNPQNPKTPSQDSTQQQLNPRRPPSLPSKRDNNEGPKRPKSKQVSSRYMSLSSSTPRRYPSPLVSRNSTPLSNKPSLAPPKRSVSADRRRPVADLHSKLGNVGEVSAVTKLLVTSTRSLSVSFQGKAFSLPISKTKVENSKPNLSNVRKVTPERKRPSTPSSRGGDQGFEAIYEGRRASFDSRLSRDLSNAELLKAIQHGPDGSNSVNKSSEVNDLSVSDTDSVSSDSTTSGVQECGGVVRGAKRASWDCGFSEVLARDEQSVEEVARSGFTIVYESCENGSPT